MNEAVASLNADPLQLGGCPTIMDGKNLTPQNAPGSTIGNLGGVLLPPRMPIFAFIGQPPCYRVSTMLYCHCERSEAISHFRLLRHFVPRNDSCGALILRPYPAACCRVIDLSCLTLKINESMYR